MHENALKYLKSDPGKDETSRRILKSTINKKDFVFVRGAPTGVEWQALWQNSGKPFSQEITMNYQLT